MNSNSSKSVSPRDSQDVIERHEERIENEHSGERAHGGDEAGPNSADAGETIAPQKGNLRETDAATGS